GLFEPGRLDDLAPDPRRVILAGQRLDDEPGQREAVVGILEPRVALDRRAAGEIAADLRDAEKGPPIEPLAAIGAVAHEPGAVREELSDRRLGDRLVQVADMLADGIVEPQPALLAQLHDARGGEALRMRGDAEAVARRQRQVLHQIGMAESALEDNPAALGDGDGATRLPGLAHLE